MLWGAKMDLNEYKLAIDNLNKMAHAYYVLDSPLASDEEYDLLYKQVLDFETLNPQLIASNSPTQRVGGEVLDYFNKSNHISRMWSLDDVFNIEELEKWTERIKKEYKNATFTLSPKFDGASLNLRYENGILVSAATRGDGLIGEEVLHNAKTIKSIPLSIEHKDLIEIRGEVLINKDDFYEINNERAESNEPLFSNPRNAAAGSLRQLDSSICARRNLSFIPWGIGAGKLDSSFFNTMKKIASFGFKNIPQLTKVASLEEIHAFYEEMCKQRESYSMMLDGMVVMVDDFNLQNELGWTIKSPRFAVAYKFPAIEKVTKILAITNQVGRSGVITPVAELESVLIEGASINRATLHNYSEIKKKDIKIGDYVIIIRSGDVIPKIIKPLIERRNGEEREINEPKFCPVCNRELVNEGIFIRCVNLNCEARIKESIIHFASKKALNIDGLGEKIVYELYDKGLISNLLDIYSLDTTKLLALPGWKEKRAKNLIDSIKSTHGVELWRFINALGIEHIGEGASKKLAKSFGKNVFNINEEDILNIEGFGEQMAKSFVKFASTYKELISNLLALIEPTIIESKLDSSSKFFNKTIVITGTLSHPREQIAALLESKGAKVTNSVSKKTDFLICGENAGSKLEKAKELGITILNESDII